MTRLRIGIPEAFFFRDLDAEVAAVVEAAMKATSAAGHELVTRDFPVDEDRTLAMYEAYQYHKGWAEESPELYLPETLRRIRAGENITAEEAQQAVAKLDETRRSAGEIFDGIDVLLTATVPVLPPTIDDLLGNPDTLRPRELVMLRNTRPFNVLGIPAINLPWDVSRGGLPVGIQLAAAPGKDFELLDIAEEFEKISPWQGRTPPQFA
jgi:Asp-tRNA(Asn)/Glu-tRNA(Gln) amidotransferase A subunit family amidase